MGIGKRVRETRRVPGGDRSMTYEITEYDPPRQSSFRVLDGPIRGVGTILGRADRRWFAFAADLHDRPPGARARRQGLLPVAKSQARKQIPQDQAKMKELLESN